MRGLRTKLADLRCSLSVLSCSYDVIIFTETWLNNSFANSELGLSSYFIFRCDRNPLSSNFLRGGGVLIAVKDTYFCRQIELAVNSIEQLFVELRIGHRTVIIGSVYIPPHSSHSQYQLHCQTVEDLTIRFPNANFLIAGDYNLPNLFPISASFRMLPAGHSDSPPSPSDILTEYISYLNFSQLNSVVNCNGKLLDLILSSYSDLDTSPVPDPLLPQDPFHPSISVVLPSLNTSYVPPTISERFRFDSANFVAINDYLASIDWDPLLSPLSVNDAVETLYSHLNHAIQSFVPSSLSIKSSYPNWFSRKLIAMVRQKKLAHRRFKISNSFSDYLLFSNLRSQCKIISRNCWRSFASRSESNLRNHPKSFWRFINGLRTDSSRPSHISYSNMTSTTDHEIADTFAEYFGSVYSPSSDAASSSFSYNSTIDASGLQISISEVLLRINSLDVNKGPGVDGIPPLFFKSCSFIMARILFIIFNKSLSLGTFPSHWKACLVTPIFKGGDRSLASSYRPICLQNTMSKIFESIVSNKLSFICKNIIINEQHGFVAGRSTVTNLLLYNHFLSNCIESGRQVDAVYTDLRKAFDTVDHSILISKLRSLGFHGALLQWLLSFLINRIQIVKYNNHLSKEIAVTSGVSQGSHLGPLLFILFINDISQVFTNCKYLLFADDLKVFRVVSSVEDALLLQGDLDRLTNWCFRNKFRFNVPKCHVVRFSRKSDKVIYPYTIHDTFLSSVDTIRDLGIYFSSTLSFHDHYLHITSSAFKTLGFIHRSSKLFNNISTLVTLYSALVRPILEYGSIIWSPYHKFYAAMIEGVQHRFLRMSSFFTETPMSPTSHDYDPVLQRLKLTTLDHRRIVADLLFIYKTISHLIDCPEILSKLTFYAPSRRIRKHDLFLPEFHRTLYGYNNSFNRLLLTSNRFARSVDFFDRSLTRFKHSALFAVRNSL